MTDKYDTLEPEEILGRLKDAVQLSKVYGALAREIRAEVQLVREVADATDIIQSAERSGDPAELFAAREHVDRLIERLSNVV